MLDEGKKLFHKYPFEAGLWYPDGKSPGSVPYTCNKTKDKTFTLIGDFTRSKIVHTFKLIFYHWLPAYLIDFLMLCFGQKRL